MGGRIKMALQVQPSRMNHQNHQGFSLGDLSHIKTQVVSTLLPDYHHGDQPQVHGRGEQGHGAAERLAAARAGKPQPVSHQQPRQHPATTHGKRESGWASEQATWWRRSLGSVSSHCGVNSSSQLLMSIRLPFLKKWVLC